MESVQVLWVTLAFSYLRSSPFGLCMTMNVVDRSFAGVLLMVLAGCAATPPAAISTTSVKPSEIQASSIEVDSFAMTRQVNETDAVYFSGWFPIADKWVQPPFHQAIASKLKDSLKPDGKGGDLKLTIVDAGFFMDMKVADSVIFVNLLSVSRERPYKCTLILNVKSTKGSERREFEHAQTTNRSFHDIEDKGMFVEQCQSALVDKVVAHLKADI